MYKIVIDTKGSDKGAATVVKGAKMALDCFDNLEVLLVGDEALIREECEKLSAQMDRVEILDAPQTVTNYDSPVTVLFEKPNSSLVKAMDALSKREDLVGYIGAGSTGAIIACATRYLSGKERKRPALSAVLPSESGGFTCVCDTGATVDCDANMLLHFAKMGSDFMKKMYGIEAPRIGLLSNGAEETKGNKVVKEAHQLIKNEEGLNFIGNVEGNRALSGVCDVLVCDGFAGNQVLKVTEGTAKRIITDVVKYAKKTGNDEMMKLVGHLLSMYDIGSLGGANVLGVTKPVIKAHGSSDEKTIVSTAKMILNMVQNKEIFDEKYGEMYLNKGFEQER